MLTKEQLEAGHRAVTRLKELAERSNVDAEDAHDRADAVLCGLLLQLGYQDVVDAFEAIKKWYS